MKVELEYKNSIISIHVSELKEFLESNNLCISSTGILYDKNKKGIVPSILNTWLAERAEYRALAKKYGESGDIQKRNFYDSRQLTTKIIANSLYGALGNAGFRFYDVDNAESITIGGQDVIKFCNAISNKWYNEKLNTQDIDYVIYTDTDSQFLSAKPFIEVMENKFDRKLSNHECADVTQKISVELEKHINASFDSFAKRFFNVNEHFFKIKQEYVGESGFWIAKKRYAQKIVMEKGVSIKDMTKGKKTWKLDVKGMDVVRSNFPKAFRTFMSNILVSILDGESKEILDDKILKFRDEILTSPILDIMMPTGIKELSKYGFDPKNPFVRFKGTTAHAKAALNYNAMLIVNNNLNVPPISDGTKIKWAYLKPNPMNLESLALTGFEDPVVIKNYVEQYIDREGIIESALENKLQSFYDALSFGPVPKNNNLEDFFSFN